ncbi:MAG: hypothetical protein GXO97_05570, partial [Nitrospirae bacterium]|nr:hypothetical protein [Nitrospirota bacterium]
MDLPDEVELKDKYKLYLKKRKTDKYISDLCQDGLIWWFNMDTPSIIAHLVPLLTQHVNKKEFPERLSFLIEATKQNISHESMEGFYKLFLKKKDLEAVAAVIGAGVASIWDSGRGFSRYHIWLKRIDDILSRKDTLSPLAIASLTGFKGLIELTGIDIKRAYETYIRQRVSAEMAGSYDLMIYFASACSYALIWMGRLNEAEMVIADAEVLSELPEVNIAVRTYFNCTRGLYYYVRGEIKKAEILLRKIVDQPFFEDLPPPAYFLTYGHLLLTLARLGKEKEIEEVARKLRERVVPESNYFHLSYLHYNLGTAYLLLGDPQRALIHANEATDRARLSESRIAPHIPALLYGQALSDLGLLDEAIEHFRSNLSKWIANNFNLLATTGCVELANIYLRKGLVERARSYLEKAEGLVTFSGCPVVLNRREGFLKAVKTIVLPESDCPDIMIDTGTRPVCIKTFGDLELRIGETILYDRKWRGGKTKTLLKALIVFGGTKVSYDVLMDTLWPEASGDTAEGNLKVTLSRLRRIGAKRDERPFQWLLVKNRRISLAKPLCEVDCLIFKETLEWFFKNNKIDIELLKKVLSLYKDDFLARDLNETWIIKHREFLKDLFVKGSIAF